jgi:AraC family transcriptional regulator of adaptative response/methylated-DNA-[protein]-cysteine methyltransferase
MMSTQTVEQFTARDADRCWQAVREHDPRYDGQFYIAVRTTGIYCRNVCGAKAPNRENVLFFDTMDEAERAGFRPCKRCRPRDENRDARAALVEAATRDIEAHLDDGAVDLVSVSERIGCSQYHLQRTFKAVTGVSPRQFASARRLERLKSGLQNGGNVTRALYDAGYGSSSGLYENNLPVLGMTPSSYRRAGERLTIGYTIQPCAFGQVLVAATERGVCAVRIGDDPELLLANLREEFAAATINADESLGVVVEDLIDSLHGGAHHEIALDIKMTAFQQRVWKALQAIPAGETRTYSEVARSLGAPHAARAVASACAANPVALAIPCHRVVRANGELGGYRWGIERKRRLLELERRESLAIR